MDAFTDTSRLSLNQYTTQSWSALDAIRGASRAGLKEVGLWRDKVAADGLEKVASTARQEGVHISSLCRGGMFPAATESERQVKLDDNRRAIDECAGLGSDTLVLVCGGLPNRDLDAARRMVRDGIEAILHYAVERGVKLGIEPLHPMFGSDRSVIVTLGQALDIAESIGDPGVGVVIDVYHVWWDPEVYKQIGRAKGRIFGFHVNDWLSPPPDVLLGRGMMGDGIIELRRLRQAVDAAGYNGPIECEIFNREIWQSDPAEVVETMKSRYLEYC